jgi:calmodulin
LTGSCGPVFVASQESRRACNRRGRLDGARRGAADRSEYNESQELENLQRVFNILVKKECGKITKEQLYKTLRTLSYPKLSMSVVEDLIWEVDEDCDSMISWEEFKAMFYRVRHDKTGWEPRRLFNLVEFMMHDKDQSGSIDMDECMEILFRRFGKDQLEARVNDFMTHDINSDKEISFSEFLVMDQKNDIAGTAKHPGFKLSAGMMTTTQQENERLIKQIRGASRPAH